MQLKSPVFDIVLAQPDGTFLEAAVQTDNRDAVRWDMTRTRRQWPAIGDAPFLWGTFMAWAAMTREGDISEDFDSFNARCLQASARSDAETRPVDPTRPAPELDS